MPRDEVLRVKGRDMDQAQRKAWSDLVESLGIQPSRVRDSILLTRDDEHGYRLHLSIKASPEGKPNTDILDRAINEVVSSPKVIPLAADQVTAVLRASRLIDAARQHLATAHHIAS